MESVIPLPDGGKIVKTNCFECHAKCGVLCEVDKDGTLVSVKGNPEDPRSEGRMCGKGLSATKILYDPDRLRWPLRRTGERGEGKWERISWDEALSWLTERVQALTDEYGAETIAYGQGTGRGTNQWTGRAGNAGGRVHHSLSPGNICLVPMMVQAFLQYGMFPTFDGCDFDNADCIVFWGANSVWTEPTYTSGQVGRSRDRGAKLIVIDPFFEHPLAAKADHFVGLRPGSDPYLAMAWLNVIMNEKLYDEEFTRKFTNAPMLLIEGANVPLNGALVEEGGNPQSMLVFDKATEKFVDIHTPGIDEDMDYHGLVKLADGTEAPVTTVWRALKQRVDEWTPERASEMCWVPADVIRRIGPHLRRGARGHYQRVPGHRGADQLQGHAAVGEHHHRHLRQPGEEGRQLVDALLEPNGALDRRRPRDAERTAYCERQGLGQRVRHLEPHGGVRGHAHGRALSGARLHHGAGQPAVVVGEHGAREGIPQVPRFAGVHGLLHVAHLRVGRPRAALHPLDRARLSGRRGVQRVGLRPAEGR